MLIWCCNGSFYLNMYLIHFLTLKVYINLYLTVYKVRSVDLRKQETHLNNKGDAYYVHSCCQCACYLI